MERDPADTMVQERTVRAERPEDAPETCRRAPRGRERATTWTSGRRRGAGAGRRRVDRGGSEVGPAPRTRFVDAPPLGREDEDATITARPRTRPRTRTSCARRASIAGRIELVERAFALPGQAPLRALAPRDPEVLLEQHEGGPPPYWTVSWPSGHGLAALVAGRDLAGRSVLELGCGLGLPSLVALRAGADVLASDNQAEALALLRRNARRVAHRPLRTLRVDLAEPPPELLEAAPFELVRRPTCSTAATCARRSRAAAAARAPRGRGARRLRLAGAGRRPQAALLARGWSVDIADLPAPADGVRAAGLLAASPAHIRRRPDAARAAPRPARASAAGSRPPRAAADRAPRLGAVERQHVVRIHAGQRADRERREAGQAQRQRRRSPAAGRRSGRRSRAARAPSPATGRRPRRRPRGAGQVPASRR